MTPLTHIDNTKLIPLYLMGSGYNNKHQFKASCKLLAIPIQKGPLRLIKTTENRSKILHSEALSVKYRQYYNIHTHSSAAFQ